MAMLRSYEHHHATIKSDFGVQKNKYVVYLIIFDDNQGIKFLISSLKPMLWVLIRIASTSIIFPFLGDHQFFLPEWLKR